AREDGPSALALLDREGVRFDLLLTDVVLPAGMSGRRVAEEVVARLPGIRVLYMSGYTENAIVHHGRLDPGVHLLGKPFRLADLGRKVREVLDGDCTGAGLKAWPRGYSAAPTQPSPTQSSPTQSSPTKGAVMAQRSSMASRRRAPAVTSPAGVASSSGWMKVGPWGSSRRPMRAMPTGLGTPMSSASQPAMLDLCFCARRVGPSTTEISRLSTSTPLSFHSIHRDSPKLSMNALVPVYMAYFLLPPRPAWEPTSSRPPRPRSTSRPPSRWHSWVTVVTLRRTRSSQGSRGAFRNSLA